MRASTLTQAAEAQAQARGFDRARVTVSDANTAAQRLYRKQGYLDTCTRQGASSER